MACSRHQKTLANSSSMERCGKMESLPPSWLFAAGASVVEPEDLRRQCRFADCTRLIPIASVMSPASLTSELQAYNITDTCPGVATLSFARESEFNFRIMPDDEIRRNSMSYYNTTDLKGDKIKEQQEGSFDYYDQPSKNVRRVAISAAYLKRPQPRENAALTFCGRGWNCSECTCSKCMGEVC